MEEEKDDTSSSVQYCNKREEEMKLDDEKGVVDFFEAVLSLKDRGECAAFFFRYLHHKRVIGLRTEDGSCVFIDRGHELSRDIERDGSVQCNYLQSKPMFDVWGGRLPISLG